MDSGYDISDAYVERNLRAELKRFADENARLRKELKVLYATNNNHVEVRVKLREELAAAQADAKEVGHA